jgi:hypothetical protein
MFAGETASFGNVNRQFLVLNLRLDKSVFELVACVIPPKNGQFMQVQ